MSRPTHLLIARDAEDAPERQLELVVDTDGFARALDGTLVARLADGGPYWLDGPAPTGPWRIKERTGRKPSGETLRRQRSITVDGERVRLYLLDEEHEAFARAAGELGIGAWLSGLAKRSRQRKDEDRSTHLRRIGRAACGMKPLEET